MSRKYIFLLSVIISLGYSIMNSFGCPVTMYSGADASIFEQVGLGMLQGKIPYVDLFDHKGFFLYIIQALALLLSNDNLGVYIFTIFAVSISVFYWITISLIFLKGWQAVLPTVFALSVSFITGLSNTTELWSLPFISYSLYVATKSYSRQSFVTKHECFIIGVGMGCILMLRMNNMATICLICLAYSMAYLCKKEYKILADSFNYTLIGFLCSSFLIIVVFVCLYGVENINALMYGSFFFNFEYASKFERGSIMSMPFYLSLVIMTIVFLVNRRTKLIETMFIFSCFALSYLTFGRTYFLHYFTTTLPLYVIALVSIMKSDFYLHVRHNFLYILFFLFILNTYNVKRIVIPRNSRIAAFEEECIKTFPLMNSIPIADRDSIWNYNGEMICTNLLQSIRTVQMNRIFLQMQLGISDDLKEIGSIETINPKWIVLKKNTIWKETQKRDSVFISKKYIPEFESVGVHNRVVVFLKRR